MPGFEKKNLHKVGDPAIFTFYADLLEDYFIKLLPGWDGAHPGAIKIGLVGEG
jgi:hypothetical protein